MEKRLIHPQARVLIIDDEADICQLLKACLSKKTSEVEYALNLKDGLEKVKSFHPSIIFLDNNLPDGTGIDYISEIKKKNRGVFLVMISAMTHLRDKAMHAGANLFLEKPVSLKVIQEL